MADPACGARPTMLSDSGLAAACPRTCVVNVCDREGDMWELLSAGRTSAAEPDGASLLGRAGFVDFIPSRRQSTPGTRKLWEGYLILSLFVQHQRAMQEYENFDPTVSH